MADAETMKKPLEERQADFLAEVGPLKKAVLFRLQDDQEAVLTRLQEATNSIAAKHGVDAPKLPNRPVSADVIYEGDGRSWPRRKRAPVAASR